MAAHSASRSPSASACASGVHCHTCRAHTRNGDAFRASFLGDASAACPYGVPWDVGADALTKVLRRLRLGDKVAAATKAVGIRPCGGCRKRQRRLNGEG